MYPCPCTILPSFVLDLPTSGFSMDDLGSLKSFLGPYTIPLALSLDILVYFFIFLLAFEYYYPVFSMV
jgi:hypothetical protein